MEKRRLVIPSIIVIAVLALSACSPVSIGSFIGKLGATDSVRAVPAAPGNESGGGAAIQEQSSPETEHQTGSGLTGEGLEAYQSELESIYAKVNPSVVNIQVTSIRQSTGNSSLENAFPNLPGFDFFFGTPQIPDQQDSGGMVSQSLGSGFVWDTEGHIVTNNHVVEGADKIQVKFSDGAIASAKVVGTDVNSDLAVIMLEEYSGKLTPIQTSESDTVKVGQVAIAIGNPYGLENTMTVGIVSAVGRSIPTDQNTLGARFTIPDIIQTDAPINPGNSGGVLVNHQGELIGVPTAIESSSGSNAGIGFAVPSSTVNRVVPALIKDGKYEHAYLGLTGTTLTPELAEAMNVDQDQRGVLVIEVSGNGPADKAGVVGSSKSVTINGKQTMVGGDIITKIDDQELASMDDLISHLSTQTEVGQKVTLTILRKGSLKTVEATLAARPVSVDQNQVKEQADKPKASQGWLGVSVQNMIPEIASQMDLPEEQEGALIVAVEAGSPADKADLKGSYKPVLINGKRVLVGGDVITGVAGKSISSSDDLKSAIAENQPGETITLDVIRDQKVIQIEVTLAERPIN